MRILHVVTAFPRSPDDVIVPWLVQLLKRLRTAGHDVEVFTSSYRGAPDQVVDGLTVHRFRYFLRRWENLTHEEAAPDRMRRSLLYRLMPAWFVVAGMFAIWRVCRRQRYDVIHVPWPPPPAPGGLRVGGPAGPASPAGDDLLRRGAPLGQRLPAVPQEVSGVGRATLGSGSGDFPLYGRRAAGARRCLDRGHSVHHVPARSGSGGVAGRRRSGGVRGTAGGAQGRGSSHRGGGAPQAAGRAPRTHR